MVTVKQAVTRATKFVEDILAGEELMNPRLEEVDSSENGDLWYVTLSFLRKEAATSLPDAIRGREYQREYKVITVRASDGEALSMKMRQPV